MLWAGATVTLFYLVGVMASLFVKQPKEDLLHGDAVIEPMAVTNK